MLKAVLLCVSAMVLGMGTFALAGSPFTDFSVHEKRQNPDEDTFECLTALQAYGFVDTSRDEDYNEKYNDLLGDEWSTQEGWEIVFQRADQDYLNSPMKEYCHLSDLGVAPNFPCPTTWLV